MILHFKRACLIYKVSLNKNYTLREGLFLIKHITDFFPRFIFPLDHFDATGTQEKVARMNLI